MMNMFELHDFLHSNIKAGADPGISVIPNIEIGRPQGGTNPPAFNIASNQQGSPFPLKTILIAGGATLLGYVLIDTFFPKNNNYPSYFERRRLARQKSTRKN